jgi:hypothetical protein
MSTKILDAMKTEYHNSFSSTHSFSNWFKDPSEKSSLPDTRRQLFEILFSFKFKTDSELFSFLELKLNNPNIWEAQSALHGKYLSEMRAEIKYLTEQLNEHATCN